MQRLKRRGIATVLLFLAIGLTLALGAGSAVADGNSGAAHACQHGGYLTLQQSDGSAFTNQSDCVSYAAGGGTLYAPALTTSLDPVHRLEPVTYSVTGFHANSLVTLSFTTQAGNHLNQQTFTTDASGAGSFSGYYDFVACPNTITVQAADPQGVTATVTQHLLCAV